MTALTYRRGQVYGVTTEANAPEARSAGQFSEYLSAEILSSASGAASFDVGPLLSKVKGALLFYFTPTLASDAGSLGGFGRLFHIGPLSSGLIGFYDKGNTRFSMERAGGGAARVPATFSAGQGCAVLVGWDAAKNYVAFAGSTVSGIQEVTNVALPTTFDAICHVGTDDVGFNYLEIKVGQVIALGSVPNQEQWEQLAGLRAARPAAWGEAGTTPSALWVGEETRVLTATSASSEIDLHNRAGGEVLLQWLDGAGIGAQRHTVVQSPLRPGAIYISTRSERRRLVANLIVHSSTTFGRLNDLRRALIAALNPARGQGVLTYVPVGSSRLYEIDAIVDDRGASLDERIGMAAYQPRIPFVSDDPDWRDVVRDKDTESVPAAGWTIPWSVPWEFTPSEVDVLVVNEGDQEVWPVIRLTAGAAGLTDPTFENETTGKTLTFSGLTVNSGDVLVVDMDARTAVVDDGTTEANVMGYRLASTQMWSLQPGTNTVRAAVASGSGVAAVLHAPRFAGV